MFIGSKLKDRMSKYEQQKYRVIAKRRARLGMAINFDSLVFAIEADNIKLVKFLIKKGVDVNKRGQDTLTPLHLAALHGRAEIIYILCNSGAHVDPILEGEGQYGLTPLHFAVQKNHHESVELLLELGASVTPKTEGTYHPIHYAVFNNFVRVTNDLLNYGADANVRFNNEFFENNWVPMDCNLWLDHDLPLLHYAILRKHKNIATMLCSFAKIDSKTTLGKTTLMQAVEVNYIKLVENLVTEENVNDRDYFGQPVLHFTMVNANRKASKFNKDEYNSYTERLVVIDTLVKNGADVNARFPENQEHSSIIHYMIKYGFTEGVRYLLFYNGDFDFNQIDMSTLYSGRILDQDLTPDISNDYIYIYNLKTQFALSMMYIVLKAITLQIIGVPVDKNLILNHAIDPLDDEEDYAKKINNHKSNIMQEIKYLKETKIGDTNITIWDLLINKTDKLVKFMSIKSIRNFKIEDQKDKIFNFYYTLEKQLRLAKKRKIFLDKSTELISSLLINCLPFDCSKKIVSFL